MAQNGAAWLPGGAREHIRRLLRAAGSVAGRLEPEMEARLRRQGYGAEETHALLTILPGSAARAPSLSAFLEEAESAGRRLAKSGMAPDVATRVLRDFDRRIGRELGARHLPAREQLQTGTIFALYRGYGEALAARAKEAEEQERRRIGRELHDEAGQSLLLLRLELELLERAAPAQLGVRLREVRGMLENTIDELRRMMAALGPGVLERLGLEAALRQMAARFGRACRAKVAVRVGPAAAEMPLEAQEVIYRVAQESLHNVARHAGATRVNLSLRSADKEIRLRVSDNGAGFSTETAAGRPEAFGLAGMRERAALLGGTLAVRSAPGKGTAVLLTLPVSGGKRSWRKFGS